MAFRVTPLPVTLCGDRFSGDGLQSVVPLHPCRGFFGNKHLIVALLVYSIPCWGSQFDLAGSRIGNYGCDVQQHLLLTLAKSPKMGSR